MRTFLLGLVVLSGVGWAETSPVFREKSSCQAIIWENVSFCRFNQDCRAVLMGTLALCKSDDCRAFLMGTVSRCATKDCRAVLYDNNALCESGNCRAVVFRNAALCKGN